MADSKQLTVKLALDGSSYTQKIKNINNENKLLQQQFNTMNSSSDKFATSLEGKRAKLNMLNQTLSNAKEKVNVYSVQVTKCKDTLNKATEAYDKQRQKVETLRQKLEQAKQTYGENSDEVKALKQELEKEEQALSKNEKAVVNANNALTNMETKLSRVEQEVNNLERAVSEAARECGEFSTKSEKVAYSCDKWGSKLTTTGNKITGVGKSLAGLSAGLIAFGASSVKTAANFEAQMSRVQAISGASATEIKKLESQAKELGATTKFSATEAAQGMEYYAMASYNADQIIAAMPATLALATASGESLSFTCDMVSDSMTAFGMSADETAHFADVLAAASTGSNTSVQLMAETFKNVAPICGTLGFSIEDASIAIGLMGNSGIKSAAAGTQLKTALANLAAPTANMKKKMTELGISLTDSNGETKSLYDVMLNLRESFADLTPTQQAAAASTIFGKEAMSGMLAVINASDKDFNKLTKNIYDCDGAAEEMAAIMQDNLSGAVTELGSAFDAVKQAIGERLTPVVKDLTKFLTELCNWFTSLDEGTQENIVRFGAFAAASSPILLVVGKIMSTIGGLITKFGGLVTAVTEAGGIGSFLSSKFSLVFKVFGLVKSAAGFVITAITGMSTPVLIVIGVITALIAIGIALYKNWDKVKETAQNVGQAIQKWWGELPGKISTWFNNMIDTIKQWVSDTSTKAMDAGSKFVENVGKFFQELPGKIGTWLTNTISSISTWVSNMATKAMEAGSRFVENLINFFSNLPETIVYWLAFIITKLIVWNVEFYTMAIEAGSKFVENMINYIKELPNKIWIFLTNTYDKVTTWASQMWTKATEMATTFVTNVGNTLQSLPGQIWSWLTQAYNNTITWASQMWSKATEAGSKFVTSVGNALRNLPGQVWNFLSQTISKVGTFVSDMGTKATSAAKTFCTNIKNGLANLPSQMVTIGKNIVQGIINGITGAVGALYDKMKSIASSALKGAKDALGIKSPSRKFRDEVGKWIPEGMAVGVERNMDVAINAVDDMSDAMLKEGVNGVALSGSYYTSNTLDTSNLTTAIRRQNAGFGAGISSAISASGNDTVSILTNILAAIVGQSDLINTTNTLMKNRNSNLYIDGQLLSSTMDNISGRQMKLIERFGG